MVLAIRWCADDNKKPVIRTSMGIPTMRSIEGLPRFFVGMALRAGENFGVHQASILLAANV